MAILGAHMSIAGGYYKAVETASEFGCDCVQLFTKNNKIWRAKELTDEDVSLFQGSLKDLKITHPISHASYLINLGAPNDDLWKKSIDAFVIELQRAEMLGIPYVVLHPGAHTTSTEEQGIQRIIKGLNEVHKQTRDVDSMCLLETTAGQGSSIGHTFEQLATILDGVRDPDRLGVCFDTCHVFAAGYPMDTESEYKATMKELNKTVGTKRIKAFHLNDSKKPLGSRVDRHDHIGEGEMGLDPFRHLLNDRGFKKVPMYLETPKEEKDGRHWDEINLETLRSLVV
ncbi:MAG: deoxyribonuclease IV [Planctomycetales bacterium]|nr:deoxyribonuclease IV [Planctomycetales bacterium]